MESELAEIKKQLASLQKEVARVSGESIPPILSRTPSEQRC